MLGYPMKSIPPDTEELQRSIRREKVLRARSMTEGERLAATLDQIDLAFEWMLEGVKQQSAGINDDEALRILAERLDRQRRREDRDLFVPAPAAA
jgi:hypothetical protein